MDNKLSVTIASSKMKKKPQSPLIYIPLDLSDVLLDEMYISSSTATGHLIEIEILSYSFSKLAF